MIKTYNSEPNIILIEDNPDDREAIVRGFESVGFKIPIRWFRESEKALQYILSRPGNMTRLMIIDLNIPGLDGRSLIKCIRSNKAICGIPIIVFTTSSDNKDIQYCYEQGANAYIQKPVNFARMIDICACIKNFWFEICLIPQIDEHHFEY